MEAAKHAYRIGRSREAVRMLRDIVRAAPSDAEARQWLARALIAAGKTGEAAAQARGALALDSTLAIPHVVLGYAYGRKRRFEEAESEFRFATDLSPNTGWAYAGLGWLHAVKGQFAEAEMALKTAIDIDPDAASAHANLGLIYLDQGRSGEAIALLRRAIELSPKEPSHHSNLGVAYSKEGRWQEASEEARDAFRVGRSLRGLLGMVLVFQRKHRRLVGLVVAALALLCLVLPYASMLPIAVAISALVLWLGIGQWRFRSKGAAIIAFVTVAVFLALYVRSIFYGLG